MKSYRFLGKALPSLHRSFITTVSRQTICPPPILNSSRIIARRTFPRKPLHQHRPSSTNSSKSSYNPTPHLNSPNPSLSLSQRLRKLSREYGWSAFGVYLLLTALDFPFCFATVRYLGTDRIGRYEHVVIEWVKSVIPETMVKKWREMREKMKKTTTEDNGERGAVSVGGVAGEETKVESYGVPMAGKEVGLVAGYDHGVKEAEKMNRSENASQCS